MNGSRQLSNLLIGILATLLAVLVIAIVAVLAVKFNLLTQPTTVPATARPVLVTRVVPGSDATVRTYPTLPPAWTDTPLPTVTATAPTATASETETATSTPALPPLDTPVPTATGPTPTRRPNLAPSATRSGSRTTPRPSPTFETGQVKDRAFSYQSAGSTRP